MRTKHISMMIQKVISISPNRFNTYLNMYMVVCSFGLVAESGRPSAAAREHRVKQEQAGAEIVPSPLCSERQIIRKTQLVFLYSVERSPPFSLTKFTHSSSV